MKPLAILAVGVALLAGGTWSSAASLSSRQNPSVSSKQVLALQRSWAPQLRWLMPLLARPELIADQVGATATPTTTATTSPTPAPSPTATGPAYPDPMAILNNRGTVYTELRSIHFDELTVAEKPSIEKAQIDAPGDANCVGPSLKSHVTGTDTIEATGQTANLDKYFVEIGKRAFEWSKHTHKRWAKTKQTTLENLVSNPLDCPNFPGGAGSGSGTLQFKDLVNLGPDTFNGDPVWHIRATIIDTSSGQTATVDYFVSQNKFLPYKSAVAFTDPTTGIQEVYTLTLTSFGKKVVVKAPVIGSKKH